MGASCAVNLGFGFGWAVVRCKGGRVLRVVACKFMDTTYSLFLLRASFLKLLDFSASFKNEFW